MVVDLEERAAAFALFEPASRTTAQRKTGPARRTTFAERFMEGSSLRSRARGFRSPRRDDRFGGRVEHHQLVAAAGRPDAVGCTIVAAKFVCVS